jgi:hypothetical protein
VLASLLGDVVGIIAIISLQGVIHIIVGPYVLARLRPRVPAPAADGVAVLAVEDNPAGG